MGRDRFHYVTRRSREVSADARDRRRAHRYPVLEDRVQLGWWHEGDFRTTAGSLINLSQTGALMLASEQPPIDRSLWIAMVGPPASDWCEVHVVGIKSARRGWFEVRLLFEESCPYAMFGSAVYGTDSFDMHPRLTPDDPPPAP